jgi:hypothetical protein
MDDKEEVENISSSKNAAESNRNSFASSKFITIITICMFKDSPSIKVYYTYLKNWNSR